MKHDGSWLKRGSMRGVKSRYHCGRSTAAPVLDRRTAVVYLPSRMNGFSATGRVGRLARAIARVLLLCLPLFLLLHFLGQQELDERIPLAGVRSVSAKVFKSEHSPKGGLMHAPQLSLAVGSRLFTPGFYLTFVRNTRLQDFVRTPLISLRSSRSPPCAAAA